MEAVLVASLGRSPAVITESVDALLDRRVRLKRVYALTTNEPTIIEKACPMLQQEFTEHYRGRITFLWGPPHYCIEKPDIEDEADNLSFLRRVGGVVRDERRRESEVYLSMAGGRKTMSAAMALVGQLYGARGIVHVLVPPGYEKGVEELERMDKAERARWLHPDRAVRRDVFFPLVGLDPLRLDIQAALVGKPPKRRWVATLLRENGYLSPEGKPTRTGRELARLLKDIEAFAGER